MALLAGVGGLADLLGHHVMNKLSPSAVHGLENIVESKKRGGFLHKLGNHMFGRKHKNARHFLRKARHIAGVSLGKDAHKVLGEGLNIGKALGVLSGDQANQILSGHEKAMSIHDKLSDFNKKHDLLSTGKSEKESTPTESTPTDSNSDEKEALRLAIEYKKIDKKMNDCVKNRSKGSSKECYGEGYRALVNKRKEIGNKLEKVLSGGGTFDEFLEKDPRSLKVFELFDKNNMKEFWQIWEEADPVLEYIMQRAVWKYNKEHDN